MEIKTKTIASVAEEMLLNMDYKKRDNGTHYHCLKKDIEWQREIIREAHLDRMPSDDIYSRIVDILNRINDATDVDEAHDYLYELESDIYTSDLTKWLASDNRNVYYLDEAKENYDCSDGCCLLMTAQKIYIEEIGHKIINGIVDYIEGV